MPTDLIAHHELTAQTPAPLILIVEDEHFQRRLIADILKREGFETLTASSGEEALELLQQPRAQTVDVLLTDWRLPGMEGGRLMSLVRERLPACARVVMTAYGSIAHAVEAIRLGADDYLAKPFEREALLITLKRALRTRALERENGRLRSRLSERDRYGTLIGQAPAMQRLYRTLQKVASTDATVLIQGESGTGKELVARTLHEKSGRAAGPFVAVNCAAIPESLMESELFGYEKGAFTGALRRREGRFEEAQGGTLFLDEIASMPLAVQATLLRVLQERRVTPLGARGEVVLNVRVVAATHRDLLKLSAEGGFREDLYYRLNVVPVMVPPLRERKEDLPLLVETLVERASVRHHIPVMSVPSELLPRLHGYHFPGNVRELGNLLERLVLLSDEGVLQLRDLPSELHEQPGQLGRLGLKFPPEGVVWDDLERSFLQQALGRAEGNRTRAAALLGMSYKTFLYRLEKYGLVS
ncbi:MAG: sigma-54-dependent transcriptional regulator [Myxococcota bacterium]